MGLCKSCAFLQPGLLQICHKNEAVPALVLFVFINMTRAPAPASVRFHGLIVSIVLVCLKLNGK